MCLTLISLSFSLDNLSVSYLHTSAYTSFQNPGNYFAILVGEFPGTLVFSSGPVFHLEFEQRPVCRGGERCRARLARRLVYSGSRLIITRPASRSLSPRHFAPPRKDSFPPARHALFRESPIRSDRSRGRSSHYKKPSRVIRFTDQAAEIAAVFFRRGRSSASRLKPRLPIPRRFFTTAR